MPTARKPVFRLKANLLHRHDKSRVWTELMRSLNPESKTGHEREKRLHQLMSDMLDHNVSPESPSLQVLQRVGDRWSPLILCILSSGTYRHTELHRVVNVLSDMSNTTHVSQRILTLKLRALERDGFLSRKVWPTVPPRTDYALTSTGAALAEWLLSLMAWCQEKSVSIQDAQKSYDRRAPNK